MALTRWTFNPKKPLRLSFFSPVFHLFLNSNHIFKENNFFLSNFISHSIERARKKLLWTWDVVTCCVLLNIYYRVLNHESVSKKRHLLYAFVIFSHLCVFYCLLFFGKWIPPGFLDCFSIYWTINQNDVVYRQDP